MSLSPMLGTPLAVREAILSESFASGKLTATTQVVPMYGAALNSTVTLTSTAAGRAISISTDGGVTFNTPATYTFSATGQLVYALTFACTHIQFTGNIGDAYMVL